MEISVIRGDKRINALPGYPVYLPALCCHPIQSIWLDLEKDTESSSHCSGHDISILVFPGHLERMGLLLPHRLALERERKIGRDKPSEFLYQIHGR